MEIKNPNASGFGAKVSGADYEPYIAADSNVKEFTVRALKKQLLHSQHC